MRRPLSFNRLLGGYQVGGVDIIALCEPLLMKNECAHDVFEDPELYRPERFMEPRNEKKDPESVMTWGARVHLCPGKMFAQYEIKIATALIVTNFKRFQISDDDYGELDYFSPSAFAERKVEVEFQALEEPSYTNSFHMIRNVGFVDVDEGNVDKRDLDEGDVKVGVDGMLPMAPMTLANTCDVIQITDYEPGHKGWLLKQWFTSEQQKMILDTLLKNASDIVEIQDIVRCADVKEACPLIYKNLVYTQSSNCEDFEVDVVLKEARLIWNCLLHSESLQFKNVMPKFDSIYSQLFTGFGSMALHKDEYVNWGVSINIGAKTDFKFGDNVVTLESGDVFVADFSKTDHSVVKVFEGTEPLWFNQLLEKYNVAFSEIDEDTVRRCRCSIQIRNVGDLDLVPDPINESEFIEKIGPA
jgi:hypothetical protein